MKDEKKKDGEKKEEKELDILKQKIAELEDKYKRALADYQNLQKRTLEEKKEWLRLSNKELLLRILPILDTLILANSHIKDQGLSLSVKQFLDILKSEGVEKIETAGKSFDPKLMECVTTVEGEENKVIDEVRPGFKIFDEVLRPAQVRVGKGDSETSSE